MIDRERSHEHGVDEREDRRVRADAERERADDDRREADVASQCAERVDDVLLQLFHHIGSLHCTLSLFVHDDAVVSHGGDVAELTQGFLSGRVGRPSGGDQSLRAHLEVERQLVVDLARDVRAAKRNAKDFAHGRSQAGAGDTAASALPTARA